MHLRDRVSALNPGAMQSIVAAANIAPAMLFGGGDEPARMARTGRHYRSNPRTVRHSRAASTPAAIETFVLQRDRPIPARWHSPIACWKHLAEHLRCAPTAHEGPGAHRGIARSASADPRCAATSSRRRTSSPAGPQPIAPHAWCSSRKVCRATSPRGYWMQSKRRCGKQRE